MGGQRIRHKAFGQMNAKHCSGLIAALQKQLTTVATDQFCRNGEA